MKNHKFIKTAFAIASLSVLTLASCQREPGIMQEVDLCPLLIDASTGTDDATRASASIIESTTLTDKFTMHVTSWMTPEDGTKQSTYFYDEPFKLDSSTGLWSSSTYKYWPIAAMLDFLCIAADDSIMDLTDLDAFKWNTKRSTSSVVVEVPNTQRRQTEILYASAYPSNKTDNVSMVFKHSQALLNFEFGSVDDQLVRLDSLTIDGIFMQGRLKVINQSSDVDTYAKWDYSYSYPITAYVPGAKGSVLNSSTYIPRKLLVPAQEVGTIRLSYTIRLDAGADWSSGVNYSRTLDITTSEWEQGKKYTYRINFKHADITIKPGENDITVEEFTDEMTSVLALRQ